MKIMYRTIFFRPISVYIKGTLVSTSNNLSNYACYILFMLMSPMPYKELRSLAIGYGCRMDTDTTNLRRDVTTKDLHLVKNTNHEIFNIP